MATITRVQIHIEAVRRELFAFGPWDFLANEIYTEFFAAEIQLAATTLAQIIGGVSPAITAITDIQFLMLYPDQAIRIGLHGVNAQTAGFTLNTNQTFLSGRGAINALNLYNTATSTANIGLVIGGT